MNHLKKVVAKIAGHFHVHAVSNRNLRTLPTSAEKRKAMRLESNLIRNRRTIFVTIRNYTSEGAAGESGAEIGETKTDKLEKLGSYPEKHFFMRKQREDLNNIKKNLKKEQESPAPSQKEEK